MTTITIDASLHLPKTRFRDMRELTTFLAQWQFEDELEKSVACGMDTPTSDFIRV